jgi:hypothetical protein
MVFSAPFCPKLEADVLRILAAFLLMVGALFTAPATFADAPVTFVRDIDLPGVTTDTVIGLVSFPAGSFQGVPYPAERFLVAFASLPIRSAIYLLPARGSSAQASLFYSFQITDPVPTGTAVVTGWVRPDGGRELVLTVAPRNVARFSLETLSFVGNVPSIPLLIGPISWLGLDSLGNGFALKSDQIFTLNISDGTNPTTPIVDRGNGDGQLSNATSLSIGPDGLMYVLDRGNGRIQGFTLAGAYVRQFPLEAGVPVDEQRQFAVAPDGRFYVGDGTGGGSVYASSGTFLGTFSTPGDPFAPRASFNNLISLDADGTLLMTDSVRQRIHEFVPPASIDALISKVLATSLPTRFTRILLPTLRAAEASLDRENPRAARLLIDAFIVEVRLLQRSHRLDATTAADLIDDAQAIIESL